MFVKCLAESVVSENGRSKSNFYESMKVNTSPYLKCNLLSHVLFFARTSTVQLLVLVVDLEMWKHHLRHEGDKSQSKVVLLDPTSHSVRRNREECKHERYNSQQATQSCKVEVQVLASPVKQEKLESRHLLPQETILRATEGERV